MKRDGIKEVRGGSTTARMVSEFKDLDAKVKSGKASEAEIARAKQLAEKIGKPSRGGKNGKRISPATNDISFYNKYPELLKDASNVIFNEIAGTKFNAPNKLGSASIDTISYPAVGVRFRILPTIGKCLQANDAFNYQMRDLWLTLHRVYRGVGTYEYADLGAVLFAIMNVFADIARAERIYGLASKFVAQNRSYPNVIMHALGQDPTLISGADLADFRYQINRAIAKAKILCLPKGFSAFETYIRLFGNLFKDSNNVRAQWFLYDSDFYVEYTALLTNGSGCRYRVRTKSAITYQTLADVVSDLNSQIDTLLSDTDVARMCSDLLKAFGDNGVQTLMPLPESFEIEAEIDDVRKLQLHNTTICGGVVGSNFDAATFADLGTFTKGFETWTIFQEGGVLKQALCVRHNTTDNANIAPSDYYVSSRYGSHYIPSATMTGATQILDGDKAMLDCWMESPSGDDIVEMTRQTVTFEKVTETISGTTYNSVHLTDYSIYVVLAMDIFSASVSAGYTACLPFYSNYLTETSGSSIGLAAITKAAALSKLDWAPMYAILSGGSGYPYNNNFTFWDIDNYTIISAEALSRIHDACTLSLFKLELSSINSSGN